MIQKITGRMILDSRGNPTVEATVTTDKTVGVASVPSGASVGSHEAKELRDGDARWGGLGVSKAVSHVNVEIAGLLKGKDPADQSGIDQAMIGFDDAPHKARLGANAVLAVSLACLQAAAREKSLQVWQHLGRHYQKADPVQLPVPFCNLINGGAHAGNSLNVQEFMIVPHGFTKFSDALRAASEIFHALGKILQSRGQPTGVGDEGGYAPNFDSHTQALDAVMDAIKQAGYEPGKQVSLALDVAANSILRDGNYALDSQPLTPAQLVAVYDSMIGSYPIVSLEDPLAEDDFDGWHLLRQRLGDRVQIVGDDLTVTDVDRIEQCLDQNIIDAAILKPNQIGTVTEAELAWNLLSERRKAGIVSHRSGETTDAVIADLAVGWGVPQIKAGSLSRGERVAKYNRLLAIEQALGGSAVYVGDNFRKATSAT